jgi:hypothetical protein
MPGAEAVHHIRSTATEALSGLGAKMALV